MLGVITINKVDFHLSHAYFSNPLKFDSILLLQIGRMFCKGDTVIEPHIHTNLYELTIVTDGKAVISTNDVPTQVKKGDIYLSHPGDIHKIESDRDEPLKYDFFAFRLNNQEFTEAFQKIAQDYALPNTRLFHDDRIRSLIGNAITELDSDDRYKDELLNLLFKQIMIYVIRGFENITPKKNSAYARKSELLCQRLMNYIDTHIYSIKNLEEICPVFNYSYGYLSSVYKKTTSNTLFDYFHGKRLEAARFLLMENRLSITEISELLNYTSVYSFSKAFKEYYGLSPKNYKIFNKK
ncbi:MAG: helix-turn-helix transcriptional regulator [Clostridia bacterium]|nr:helix-turn-helix transcriptional regulator [Clostridia bacterium]